MDELLKIAKKQLRFQKVIALCLVLIAVVLGATGYLFVNQVDRMTTALEETTARLREIDVEGINSSISVTQELLESVEDFSTAVDGVTEKVKEFDSWMLGLLGGAR